MGLLSGTVLGYNIIWNIGYLFDYRRYRHQPAKLSAFTETGQAELSIEVPLQRSYTGRFPVIPSSLADTPCATLGIREVVYRLNATLGTSRTSRKLRTILEDFIRRNYDFGTAYALLRPVWDIENPSSIQNELRRREGKDREHRQKALKGNRIVDPNLTPRRVWDLCSNRVVPSWITDKRPTPISHAWVDEKDRVDVRTPINGKEWPVPIPKDADLNLIRIEMLNLGAEYVWLDVLCLRQKEEGGPREDLRMQEWRLDVPTIGAVYSHAMVVIYLSGLGRPLRLKDIDLDSDRNWFRRTWTRQEVGDKRIIAGDTPDGPMHAQQIDGNYETALLTRFHKELHSLEAKLSAFTETGQAELSIEVPLQRSYTGRFPVIPSSLADTPCATLGIQGVFNRLNATLGTPGTSRKLRTILEDFIERNYDFGTAYALLRPVWDTKNPRNIQDELRRRKGEDKERRQKALVGNLIVDPELPPRRVWDLYSNRVMPSWITDKEPTLISHAWVDEKDRVDVRTPINGRVWPVPIPKDADLNLIRIEMLNTGAEYAWLDVLCLRQKEEGGPREDLRVEEWRLDVPTIGGVYKIDVHESKRVVIYLSGLGRPLRLKDSDLDSDRNWFRRAWTLQEVGHWPIIAGDMPDGPMHARQIDGGNYETALLTRFHKEMHSVERGRDQIFAVLADMQKRVSTNPVDRVAGLAFLLKSYVIPAYHESETLEAAWTALVNAIDPGMRARFLFVYPGVGLGRKKWRPTWDQVMKQPLPKDAGFLFEDVHHDDETDEDWYEGSCIEKGHVRVFDVGSAEGHDRCGELVVKAADGIAHEIKIRVTHRFPIPEDTYMLLGNRYWYEWAVGRRLPDQRFEKVSVIVMDWHSEVYRLYDPRVSLVARSRNVLV